MSANGFMPFAICAVAPEVQARYQLCASTTSAPGCLSVVSDVHASQSRIRRFPLSTNFKPRSLNFCFQEHPKQAIIFTDTSVSLLRCSCHYQYSSLSTSSIPPSQHQHHKSRTHRTRLRRLRHGSMHSSLISSANKADLPSQRPRSKNAKPPSKLSPLLPKTPKPSAPTNPRISTAHRSRVLTARGARL